MSVMPDPLLQHLRSHVLLKLVLASFLIYWAITMFVLVGKGSAPPTGFWSLLPPVVVTMYWTAASMSSAIGRTVEVFGHLQAPHNFVRAVVTEKLNVVALAWIMLCLGTALQLALPGSQGAPLATIALISLVGVAGLLRGLARAGVLLAHLAAPLSALPIVLGVAIVVFHPTPAVDWFGALPMAIHVLLALALPALVLGLRRRWTVQAPAYRWREKRPSTFAWIGRQARRFTFLTRRKAFEVEVSQQGRFWLVLERLAPFGLPYVISGGLPAWEHGTLSLVRLAIIPVMVFQLSNYLVLKDFHWRALLQPGGPRQGRIGTGLWLSTFGMQLAVLLPLAMALVAFSFYGMHVDAASIAEEGGKRLPVLLELMAATSVAVLLRGAGHRFKWIGIVLALMAFAAIGLTLSHNKLVPAPHLSFAWYAAGMLGVTAASLALANRLWTPNLLFSEVTLSQAD